MYDIHCLWLMSETYDDACLSTPVWGCTAAVQHCNAAVHSAQCACRAQCFGCIQCQLFTIVNSAALLLVRFSNWPKDWIGEPAVQWNSIKSKARWDLGVKVTDATMQFATYIALYYPLLTLASATLHCTRLVYTEYCYPLLSCIALCHPLLPLCCVALRLRRIFFTVLSWITLYHCCLLCCQC